jgi:hypothetical protein
LATLVAVLRGSRLRRLAPYLVAVLIAVASIFGLVVTPATGTSAQHADYVVIAGAAGLRWDDVNPTDSPTMWALARRGSIGALSVRSAHTPTCPLDGWLTLGAGNVAVAPRTAGSATTGCDELKVTVQGGRLPDQQHAVDVNQELPYGTQPGALAEAVRCTYAVGPGAAEAAARPFGGIDRYLAELPPDAAGVLSTCVLSIVDLGTVSAADPTARRAEVRRADAVLAEVVAARPGDSLLIVAGLSDTSRSSRLHVAIADGPGYEDGWLTSSSTSRRGYLQLTDLAPTALNVLDKPLPTNLFTGQPAAGVGGRPADLATAVSFLSDADREAGAQHGVAGHFYLALTIAELLLFAAVVPLLRRARRHAGQHGPRPAPRWLAWGVEVALVTVSVSLPAALIADAVPWWRATQPGIVFGAVVIAVAAALTVVIVSGPWWHGAVGLVGAVGAVAAVTVAIDVLTGSRLQLNGVAGYSALDGVRYAGIGTIGLGLFLGGILLAAGWLAQRSGRRWRPVMISVVGGMGVVLVGSPFLGADVGGAIALTAGVCVAAALSTGGWLTFTRLAWATLAGVAVTVGFAVLDLQRAPESRGSLGRFITEVRDGNGSAVAHRLAAANASVLVDSPLSLVVIGGAALIMFALIRPWGGLKRLFGLYPAVRAVLIGGAVAAVLAGSLDGTGLDVAGAATVIALPLAALGALRVLDHADDRTVAAAVRAAIEAQPEPVPVPVGDGTPTWDERDGDGEADRDDEVDSDAPSSQAAAGAPTGTAGDVLP